MHDITKKNIFTNSNPQFIEHCRRRGRLSGRAESPTFIHAFLKQRKIPQKIMAIDLELTNPTLTGIIGGLRPVRRDRFLKITSYLRSYDAPDAESFFQETVSGKFKAKRSMQKNKVHV